MLPAEVDFFLVDPSLPASPVFIFFQTSPYGKWITHLTFYSWDSGKLILERWHILVPDSPVKRPSDRWIERGRHWKRYRFKRSVFPFPPTWSARTDRETQPTFVFIHTKWSGRCDPSHKSLCIKATPMWKDSVKWRRKEDQNDHLCLGCGQDVTSLPVLGVDSNKTPLLIVPFCWLERTLTLFLPYSVPISPFHHLTISPSHHLTIHHGVRVQMTLGYGYSSIWSSILTQDQADK